LAIVRSDTLTTRLNTGLGIFKRSRSSNLDSFPICSNPRPLSPDIGFEETGFTIGPLATLVLENDFALGDDFFLIDDCFLDWVTIKASRKQRSRSKTWDPVQIPTYL
jgi:hypothetical protein